MYHKFRITIASLVITTICILSSTATLSYFTDTDTITNDFTVGNASTTLTIYDDVSSETREDWRTFDIANYPPLTDEMDMPFYPQAVNDGNIPVYQRFRIVIPTTLASTITLDLPDNMNCIVETALSCANNDYTVTYNPTVEINNEPKYAEYYFTSNNVLSINSTTKEWPTEKIHINGISEANKSLFTCETNDNNCTLGIHVYSDAIQTTGFQDAESAFANFAETYNN
ncbi:SipW-dependent-type signal peptide-containing protein [Candidatus Saccharibacteria bacterium]|nr:SipW-dependent-type signal peptide-containing protein [Candidatus Saccharibacteria bacterium]